MTELWETLASFYDKLLEGIPWGTLSVIVIVSVAVYRGWKLRRVRGLKDSGHKLIEVIAADLPGVSRLFAKDGTVSDELKAIHYGMIEEEAAKIFKEAQYKGNRSLINQDIAAFKKAPANLSVSQILSLQDKPETLLQIYLNTVRVEIKDDQTFERIKPRIARMFKALLDNPSYIESIARFRNVTNDAGFTVDVDIETHLHEREALSKESAANLNYDLRSDDFVGRGDLLDHLVEEFLNVDEPDETHQLFRWTLIYGGAGSGKSRLAVELLRDVRVGQHFNVAGFVGRMRDAPERRLSAENASRWQNSGHTFFVLDYAGHHDHLADVLLTLHKRARETGKKIRLLLLERRGDEAWTNAIRGGTGGMSALRDTRYEVDGNLDGPVGHPLRTTDKVHLGAIPTSEVIKITERRILAKRPLGLHETPETLENEIWSLDPDLRPLFAAVVGHQLGEQDALTADQASSSESREERTEIILRDIINRERIRFWLLPNEQEEEHLPHAHENLLALSTMCRGAPYKVIYEERGNQALMLPSSQDFDQTRYSRMASNPAVSRRDGDKLGFLLPDFVGEWFVLDKLNRNRPGFDPQVFVNKAWESEPSGVETFIFQCYQNHPDRVAELGYLLSDDPAAQNRSIRLLGRLIAATAMFAKDVWVESEGSSDNLANIVEHLRRLFDTLRDRVVVVGTDIESDTQTKIADATSKYVETLAFFVSPTQRYKDQTERHADSLEHMPQENAQHRFRKGFRLGLKGQFQNVAEETDKSESTEILRELFLEYFETWEPGDEGTSTSELAARLLRGAAAFFETFVRENPQLAEPMKDHRRVFLTVADYLDRSPAGTISVGAQQNYVLASNLLAGAAEFFGEVSETSEDLAEQMEEAQEVFETIAKKLRMSPDGVVVGQLSIPPANSQRSATNESETLSEELTPVSAADALDKIIGASTWLETVVRPPWQTTRAEKGPTVSANELSAGGTLQEAHPSIISSSSGQFHVQIQSVGFAVGDGPQRLVTDRPVAAEPHVCDTAVSALVNCWAFAIDAAADNDRGNRARKMTRRILDPLTSAAQNFDGLALTRIAIAHLARRYARILTLRANGMISDQPRYEADGLRQRAAKLALLASELSLTWAPDAVDAGESEIVEKAASCRAQNLGMAAYAVRGLDKRRQLEILYDLEKLSQSVPNSSDIVDAASFTVEGMLGYENLSPIATYQGRLVVSDDLAPQIWQVIRAIYPRDLAQVSQSALIAMLGSLSRLVLALPPEEQADIVDRIARVFSTLDDGVNTYRNISWASHLAAIAMARLSNTEPSEPAERAYQSLIEILSSMKVPNSTLTNLLWSFAGEESLRPASRGDGWTEVSRRIQQAIEAAIEAKDSELALSIAIYARAAAESWHDLALTTLWNTIFDAPVAVQGCWLLAINKRSEKGMFIGDRCSVHLAEALSAYPKFSKNAKQKDLQIWTNATTSLFVEPAARGEYELLANMLDTVRLQPDLPRFVWFAALLTASTGAGTTHRDLVETWARSILDTFVDGSWSEHEADIASRAAAALATECFVSGSNLGDELVSWLDTLSNTLCSAREENE